MNPADGQRSGELELAERSKREYLWPEAAGAYQRAVDLARRAGDVESAVSLERELALCHFRSAFQSANRAAFLSRMKMTEAACLRAIESSRSLADPLRLAFSAQLEGDLGLARSLHSGGSDERRRLLRQSSQSRREAFERFKKLGREKEALRATLDHLEALVNELNMEWSPPRRLAIIAEGLGIGAEGLGIGAEGLRAKATTEHGRAWICYSMGVLMHRQVYLLDDAAARERAKKESIEYATKAVELSGTTDDKFLASKAHLSAISAINYGGRSRELFKRYLAASLESANATRDVRLIADVLAATAYDLTWDMLSEEIPERLTSKFEECKRLVEEAAEKYDAVVCEEGEAAANGSSLVLAYYRASLGVDKARKSELLEDAARIGTKALDSFARSGRIGFEGPIDNTPAQNLGYVLIEQALLSEGKRRKALFAEAAKLSSEVLRYRESFEPFNKWDRGIDLDTEASIQVELSRIGTGRRERVDLLRAAAGREREAMRLCRLHFAQSEFADVMAVAMASVSNRIYRAYHELYDLTGETEARDAMMAALKEVAGLYERAGQPSRAAQAHWRMAQLWDRDGAYAEASDEFAAASRQFDSAAKATQQFAEYFADYSRYMKAWSFISEARAKTKLQDYEQASGDYSSSSELLGGTKRWRHARGYFDAWARLQMAEAYSANERFSEAIRAFDDARDLFSSAPAADQESDSQIVTVEEVLDVSALGSIRKRYCEGRAALESARKFDAEGEKPRSASQFAAASSIFGEIASDVGPGSERDEFSSMSLLCRGWKLLEEGEMNRSGALFAEAARAFEEASRLRVTDRVALVATANSNYCEAMREGLDFGKKGDDDVYAKAKRHLEAARIGYADAELHRDATWTEVAMSVLDARLYLFKGEATTNPVERVKLYAMTEKSLASALSLAAGAGYGSRVIPVEKELSRLRRKAAVAKDLAQMIAAPPISAPGALVQAQPTEEASGLAAFERVNLQGQLRHEGQVEVGETFEVQLDVFNSGSQSASLLKVEEMAPSGLKLVSAQEPYLIEEGATLDTRERLVQPLRIQSFRVSLMAQDAGEKTLSPRLVYRDQVGRVGILPLLGTSVRVLPHSVFEFRTPTAKLVFDSLVREFVKDYMHEKLSPEQSGWRSRGQIEKIGKVPRSALYEAPGKYGSPLYELLSRGLVESRTFRKQRGRGGEATKLRILYDNEVVKRYVDRWVKSKR